MKQHMQTQRILALLPDKPIRYRVTKVVIAPITTSLSIDPKKDVGVLLIFCFFSDLQFLFLNLVFNSLMFLIELLKLITSFLLHSNLCFQQSVQLSSGADGYILGVFLLHFLCMKTQIEFI